MNGRLLCYVRGFTQLPQKRKAATYFEGRGGHGRPILDGSYVTQRVRLAYSKPGTSTGPDLYGVTYNRIEQNRKFIIDKLVIKMSREPFQHDDFVPFLDFDISVKKKKKKQQKNNNNNKKKQQQKTNKQKKKEEEIVNNCMDMAVLYILLSYEGSLQRVWMCH